MAGEVIGQATPYNWLIGSELMSKFKTTSKALFSYLSAYCNTSKSGEHLDGNLS